MARTTALNKIEEAVIAPTFYKVVQGGTSAGKTFAIMTLLIGYAESYPGTLTTVVGMSFPHLAGGAIRDFQKIMKEQARWSPWAWNKTEHIYYFPNGSIIEFVSVDKMGALGRRRDVLFVNEANGISYEVFDQLAVRTSDFCIIDYNPSSKFWAHEELVGKQPEKTSFLILTYKDNEALLPQIRENIESHAPKPGEEPSNWWTVYGLGQIGSLEGNVYEGWLPVDEIPEEATLKRVGVDFGFNDPTTAIAVYEDDDHAIYLDEAFYERKLTTPDIISRLKPCSETLCVCDSARPEIIREMQANGLRAIACNKTPGEKMNGKRYNIELVQRRKVHYTQRSTNLEREYLTYRWRQKRTGETLDEPEDGHDHCMDAIAYAIRDMNRKPVEYAGVRT